MPSLSLIFSLDKNMKINCHCNFVILYPILNGAQSNGNSAVSIYGKKNKYINKLINRHIKTI